MENITLENDIPVFCVTARSFPEGIMEAHQKLHSLIPFSSEQKYYGISRPNEKGLIIYKAAVEGLNSKEIQSLGLESFIIRGGSYISILIKDYFKDPLSISKAFQKLISRPDIDPQGYCIESYMGEKDVRCMVRLK